jgi:dCTP deaminase
MSFWTSEHFLAEGRAVIRPFYPEQVVNCAYELKLGREGYVTSSKGSRTVLERDGDQLIIPPGQFALLLSDEQVIVPDNAIGFISIRTKFKLSGLINVSGFHVDPGFRGRLIYSVYNAGGRPALISRGEPAFLFWLASLEEPTTNTYKGSHQGQMSIPNDQISTIGDEHYSPAEVNERLTKVENLVRTASRMVQAIFVAIVGGLIVVAANWGIDQITKSPEPTGGSPSSQSTDK